MKVYLCGGINGMSDDAAKNWREEAKSMLEPKFLAPEEPVIECLDPMRRDYRGKEDDSVEEIYRGDLEDIVNSDLLLVNASRPSWGTAMEMVYARMMGKPVIVIITNGPISPWLRKHSTSIVSSVYEGCAEIARMA